MSSLDKVLVAALGLAAAACGGDDATDNTWQSPNFDQNAAEALALRAQLSTLVDTMRAGEEETAPVTEKSQLTTPYGAGDPSLADVANPGFAPMVDESFDDFVVLAIAGPQDLIDESGNWSPGDDGGIFGSGARGLNAGGLEVRQIIDKGLFGGGGLYAYALSLTEGDITPETIDAIAAAWGTNATLDPETAEDSAGYAHGMGFHAEAAAALTEARVHAEDGSAAERDQALTSFFTLWEQALVARTIYYANEAAIAMAAAADDDSAKADALHELAEGIGLALGFYGLPDPSAGPLSGSGRIATDAQIEAMMTALGVDIDDLSASTTGEFVSDLEGFETAVGNLETEAVDAYGFSEADLETFRAPTDG